MKVTNTSQRLLVWAKSCVNTEQASDLPFQPQGIISPELFDEVIFPASAQCLENVFLAEKFGGERMLGDALASILKSQLGQYLDTEVCQDL